MVSSKQKKDKTIEGFCTIRLIGLSFNNTKNVCKTAAGYIKGDKNLAPSRRVKV